MKKIENNIKIFGDYSKIIINSQKYGIKEVLIDTEDIKKINNIKWNLNYNSKMKNFYAIGNERKPAKERKTIRLHRLILDCPKGFVIDHINRNPLDNRKCNLRIVTQDINMANVSFISKNKSGHKNIYKDKNKWRVLICTNYIIKNYGSHNTIDEAINARDRAFKRDIKC